jgi:hypothetical protein
MVLASPSEILARNNHNTVLPATFQINPVQHIDIIMVPRLWSVTATPGKPLSCFFPKVAISNVLWAPIRAPTSNTFLHISIKHVIANICNSVTFQFHKGV